MFYPHLNGMALGDHWWFHWWICQGSNLGIILQIKWDTGCFQSICCFITFYIFFKYLKNNGKWHRHDLIISDISSGLLDFHTVSSEKGFVSNWGMTVHIRHWVFSKYMRFHYILHILQIPIEQWETTLTWFIHLWHIINFHTLSSRKGYCGCHMNQHKTHSCWKEIDLIYITFLCSIERVVNIVIAIEIY